LKTADDVVLAILQIVRQDDCMVRNLIRKLGGPAAIAVWCGSDLTGNAVTAWGSRNQIPWKWRAHIRAMADAKGVQLNAREEKALALMNVQNSNSIGAEVA
jgi:hypothetical protein